MPPYNPDVKMSNTDKILTAGWFRRINDAILEHTYPDDMIDYVKGVVKRNKARATELEQEVYAERVTAW